MRVRRSGASANMLRRNGFHTAERVYGPSWTFRVDHADSRCVAPVTTPFDVSVVIGGRAE